MKDLNTGNLWLWERGKFMNRRYMMQEMYQQFLAMIPSLECVRMSCHSMRQLDELLDCLVGELNFPKDLFN